MSGNSANNWWRGCSVELRGFKGEIKRNELLSRHTSFGIGGPVDVLACPADQADLSLLLSEIRQRNLKYFILGSGTNLLVKDGGFRGVAINLKHLRAITIERQYRALGGHFAVIHADAGVLLSKLLAFSADEGFTGMEFAAGIPGTLGGAICMNAGTATGEIGDIIDAITVVNPKADRIIMGRSELQFGYRTSSIPPGYIVISARLILRRDEKQNIMNRVRSLNEQRKQRQPGGYANAGSVFKNPQDTSAGKLIDEANLKGTIVGGAEVSPRHANFIVNRGTATAADVLSLMDIVTKAVLDVHGVRLEPEIKIIGED